MLHYPKEIQTIYLPITGNDIDALGIRSATKCKKTIMINKIDIIRLISSPLSLGKKYENKALKK